MKKLIIFSAAILALSSCVGVVGESGNGISVEQAIEVGDFSSISVPSSVDVYYTQGNGPQRLMLTCDENLVEYYRIEVKNGRLVVDTKPNAIFKTKAKTFLTVNSPVLDAVKLSGSGDVFIDSPIVASEDFAVSVSGSGDVKASGVIECRNFSAHTTGSGDSFFGGILASSAEFKDTGSGNISSQSVTAEDISISISGSGDCTLDCRDAGTVSVKISGSGDVTLTGSVRTLGNLSLSGSGDLDVSRLSVGK